MAYDNKPNLDNCHFEQCAGDVLNLSGKTQIMGASGQLIIRNGAGEGKVLTSDVTGLTSWQTPVASITGATNGLGITGKKVCLGGALVNNTAITGAFTLSFSGGSKLSTYCGYQICGFDVLRVPRENFASLSFAVGNSALLHLSGSTTGIEDTAIGQYSQCCTTTGSWNTSLGVYSLKCNVSGCYNTAVGARAMCKGGALHDNVAVGAYTLAVTCGAQNVVAGTCALIINTSGSGNTAMGHVALNQNISGSGNVAIGRCAGFAELGSNKLYIANNASTTLIYGEFDNEKLCFRGKLYVSGLTNSTKTNVIYYDSSTKELTYGATPSSGSTGGITGATNGLSISSCKVKLGGALTGNTIISGAYTLSLCSGAKLNTICGYQISGTTMFRTTPSNLANIAIGVSALNANSTGGTDNIAIGCQTLYYTTNGSGNIALGSQILCCNTCGCFNAGIGYQALMCNTKGCSNIAIGDQALLHNVSGNSNMGFGYFALQANTAGCTNIGIGCRTLQVNQTGNDNVAIGASALQNTTSSNNIGIGASALITNTTGNNNIALGNQALYLNQLGCNNVAIGKCAGCLETGSNKLYIANNATSPLIYGDFSTKCLVVNGQLVITGVTNCSAGNCALVWDSATGLVKKAPYSTGGTGGGIAWTGSTANGIGTYVSSSEICSQSNLTFDGTKLGITGNVCASSCVCSPIICGTTCMKSPIVSGTTKVSAGCYQIAGKDILKVSAIDINSIYIGCEAGNIANFGTNNIGLGAQSICSLVNGTDNIGIGYQALLTNNNGINNIAIGTQALFKNTGCGNVAIGCMVLSANTTGCGNLGIGCVALIRNTNGYNNVAVGCFAMCCNISGFENIAIGSFVMVKNTTGGYNIAEGFGALGANTIGNHNVAIGFDALAANVCGCGNIGIGNQALSTFKCGNNNVAVGCIALQQNISGVTNVALGHQALPSITKGNYNIGIGFQGLVSNQSGCYNIGIGYCAGASGSGAPLTGSSSIFFGNFAGHNETGSNKLHIANASGCTLICGDFINKTVCIDNTLFTCNICSPSNLLLEVPDVSNIYLNATCVGSNFGNIYLGKPTTSSSVTTQRVSATGAATNIDIILLSKGSGSISSLASTVNLSSTGAAGFAFTTSTRVFQLPCGGKICGYGGSNGASYCDATPIAIVGGYGNSNVGWAGSGGTICIFGGNAGDGIGGTPKKGGDVIISAGNGVSGGATGCTKICGCLTVSGAIMPASSADAAMPNNSIYYSTNSSKLVYKDSGGSVHDLY